NGVIQTFINIGLIDFTMSCKSASCHNNPSSTIHLVKLYHIGDFVQLQIIANSVQNERVASIEDDEKGVWGRCPNKQFE
ncbi:MAG: hypothetical protein Q4A54_14450, partial [Parabacteroides sp.]|nr:hypothetical protein [Parabacteroides sp.]